jgi:UDP-glucuronate decarboxylase
MLRLMDSPDDITGPINIGNPGEFTMNQLADIVLRLTGSPSRIDHRPLPADDPRQRRPDIARATALLNWEPTIALEAGLKRTIAYFADYLRTEEKLDIPFPALPSASR